MVIVLTPWIEQRVLQECAKRSRGDVPYEKAQLLSPFFGSIIGGDFVFTVRNDVVAKINIVFCLFPKKKNRARVNFVLTASINKY